MDKEEKLAFRDKDVPLSESHRKVFWDKVIANTRVANNGCWEWQAYRDPKGYGGMWVAPYTYKSHRAALIAVGYLMPLDTVVDHECKNTSCCNPMHLRVVSHRQNSLENSRSISAVNHAKILCKRGHPLSGKNLIVRKSGARTCRSCYLNSLRKWRRQRKDGK